MSDVPELVRLLPPLGEGWDGGAEVVCPTRLILECAATLCQMDLQPGSTLEKPPSQPSPKGGKEEFRLGVMGHSMTMVVSKYQAKSAFHAIVISVRSYQYNSVRRESGGRAINPRSHAIAGLQSPVLRNNEPCRPIIPSGARCASLRFAACGFAPARLFHWQRHTVHGRRLAHGRTGRVVLPGGAGANRRVFADVPAGVAGRCAGRHHRPPAPDLRRAAGAGGRMRAAGSAGAGRPGRAGVNAFSGVRVRLLHCGADAGLELVRDRPGSPGRMDAGITAVGIAYKRGPRQKKQCRGSPPGFAAAACATAKRFLWASAPPPTPSPAFTAAKTSANASFGCNRHTDAGQQIVSKRLRFSVDLT